MKALAGFASVVCAVCLAAPAAAVIAPPKAGHLLVLSSSKRLVVRGSHFAAGERVAVSASGRTTTKAVTHATASGTFRVTLKRPTPQWCGRIVVRAVGGAGHSAVVLLGMPECNPPSAD
jgi:hypothetical protein